MNNRHPMVVHEEIERYRAQARAMQSREVARLARRLAGVPARLLARPRAGRIDPAGPARLVQGLSPVTGPTR